MVIEGLLLLVADVDNAHDDEEMERARGKPMRGETEDKRSQRDNEHENEREEDENDDIRVNKDNDERNDNG